MDAFINLVVWAIILIVVEKIIIYVIYGNDAAVPIETREIEKLTEKLNIALKSVTNQKNFFEYTASSHETEWNLAHHLANEISKEFPTFNCDIELRKSDFGSKRPDIVIHQRCTNDNNYLVIEVKRDPGELDRELEKIKSNWFLEPLSYKYRAVVIVNNDNSFVRVIENNR